MAHPLVVHCMKSEYDVYIGRWHKKIGYASKWANPYVLDKEENREKVLEQYKKYLLNNDQLLLELHELKGKRLGCWCAPKLCHGDILAELANEF